MISIKRTAIDWYLLVRGKRSKEKEKLEFSSIAVHIVQTVFCFSFFANNKNDPHISGMRLDYKFSMRCHSIEDCFNTTGNISFQ